MIVQCGVIQRRISKKFLLVQLAQFRLRLGCKGHKPRRQFGLRAGFSTKAGFGARFDLAKLAAADLAIANFRLFLTPESVQPNFRF